MFQSVLRQVAWRREAATLADTALLRAAVIAACVLSIGIAAGFGDPSGYLTDDPALARLLRAMAVIKGMLALAALGAVLWRFGWSVSKPAAFTYIVGSSVLTGSSMLIWQLTYIPLAAVLFHAAALCMLVVCWREAR
jgi:hypothetical protein